MRGLECYRVIKKVARTYAAKKVARHWYAHTKTVQITRLLGVNKDSEIYNLIYHYLI